MQAVKVFAVVLAATAPLAADPLRDDGLIARPPERPKPAAPKPAPEIAQVGAQFAGTWTCTGAVDRVEVKLVLDNAWIAWTIAGAAGTTMQYRTYDAVAKQWTMIELTSSGKHRTLTSLGDEKGLWTWTLDDSREHETLAQNELVLGGDRRRGTTWAKHYEATCRRK